MPNPFLLTASVQGEITIIALEGYLDAHTAPQFEEKLQAEIEEVRNRIIVDCAKLTYISSAGLGVFMSFIEEIREQGGDINICGLAPKVRHTFEILGFQDIFDLLEDVPSAVQRFAESPIREG